MSDQAVETLFTNAIYTAFIKSPETLTETIDLFINDSDHSETYPSVRGPLADQVRV